MKKQIERQLETIKEVEKLIMDCEKTTSTKVEMLKLIDRYKKILKETIEEPVKEVQADFWQNIK
jgi:hypothetical protein